MDTVGASILSIAPYILPKIKIDLACTYEMSCLKYTSKV